MRLKCRCKVEVMNSLEGTNSWHTAEVLSGDGRTYTVRYDSCSRFENSSMEVRVPKKFIRPYPPPVQSGEIWQVSDLVEVCSCDDVCSWKAARVLMILGGDRYLVRLLGCSQEISIHKSRMRRRQCWKDGKWFLLPKDSGSYGHIKYREPPSDCWTNINGGSDHVAFEDITRLHDSHVISSRSLKRMSPHYSSAGETYPQEFGALGTNCKRRKINSPQSRKKGHWSMRPFSHSSKGDSRELPDVLMEHTTVHYIRAISHTNIANHWYYYIFYWVLYLKFMLWRSTLITLYFLQKVS
ncbi:unnamed protein product [Cuscuta campestris]|uniref:Agenet domain-containing protein n=1 Tax=Cuscuta campestris TaxID=132261 RepID=A0A484M715_9ASTE|nr:unnamed protein product [Cuscuta campestris]